MARYNDNLKAAEKAAMDAAQSADIAALKGLLTIGTTAPSAKPTAKGLLYFDSTNKKLYVSKGTSDASDWQGVVSAT